MTGAPMKIIAVLGSTGSIGTNTLEVVRRNHHLYQAYSLVAGQNIETLAAQILEFRPKLAGVVAADGLARLTECLHRSGLPRTDWPEVGWGGTARVEAVRAAEVDTVISAIVGVAGLEATYEAVCLGKRVGLANKEVLVSGGSLVMQAVRKYGAELLPVDSEHNGAHQCLRAGNRAQVCKLILTASGGPFRNTPARDLAFVTPAEAC